MRVLLVDDSAKHRRAGKRQLEALGHEVVATCEYREARKLVQESCFDVALLDLLMPAESTTLAPDARAEHVGREIAIGFPLALAFGGSVPRIAVATDTNHHAHPMSAAVDWFQGMSLSVGGSKILIMHAPLAAEGRKDYGAILRALLSD
jgi:CheY-like chemotaxis protein